MWVPKCVKKKRRHLLRLHELGQSDAPSGDWLRRNKSPLWRGWDLPTVLAEDKNILRNDTCPLSSGHQATTVISKKSNFPKSLMLGGRRREEQSSDTHRRRNLFHRKRLHLVDGEGEPRQPWIKGAGTAPSPELLSDPYVCLLFKPQP